MGSVPVILWTIERHCGVPILPTLFACRAVHQVGTENPVESTRDRFRAERYQIAQAFNTIQPIG